MGEVFRTLFGGKKSTAVQQSQSTSQSVDMTPGEFVDLRDNVRDTGQSLMRTRGTSYGGPLAADITGTEKSVLDELMRLATGSNPRRDYLDSVIAGNYQGGPPGWVNPMGLGGVSNPFLEAAIRSAQRPTLQGLEETVSRVLPGRFTQAGHFVQPQGSSAFDRAAALATRGAADAMGDIATNMGFASYEAERGRQFDSTEREQQGKRDFFDAERNRQQQAAALSREEVDTTIANLQAQALPRLIQDMGVQRGVELFKTQVQELLQVLQTLGALASPNLGTVAQSTARGESQSTEHKGVVPGISGLIASIGGVPAAKQG